MYFIFTLIRTKWLLVPLFLFPFCYHVGVEDIARLRDTVNPVTFAEGMQEMSVLCIMLSLLFTALAMKKLVKEPKEQPWEPAQAPEAPAKPAAVEKEPIVVEPPAENVEKTEDSI